MATQPVPMSVGVVPEPKFTCPGLSRVPRSYASRQVTTGSRIGPASKRYMAWSETMNTPPVSSTANELPIASPARRMVSTAPLAGSTVPTSAFTVTNQRSPLQSGRHEMMPSLGSTMVDRS